MIVAKPACGNCYFARDPNGKADANPNNLRCWGAPPVLIDTGTRRKIPGIRVGTEADRLEIIFRTENVPVKPERPACALWQCSGCGMAAIFSEQEHICPARQEGEVPQ